MTGRQLLVLGSAEPRPESFDDALRIAREHVERSRAEPGCLAHAVHRDAESPHRLVFVERWQDRAALAAHVALPASRAFGRALTGLCTEPPGMSVWDAEAVELAALLGRPPR